MTQQSVVLELPEELYERIRLMADTANRPIEEMIADGLDWIFAPSDAASFDPDELESMTDDELWTVVHRTSQHLAWSINTRSREFREHTHLPLTEDQERERDDLVTEYNHYIFLRSKALLLLKERGRDVETYLRARN